MCQKSERNALGNLTRLHEAPYKKQTKWITACIFIDTVVKFLWVILVVGTVTESSQFTWDFPGFKTESPTSHKAPQAWANWNG